ncbi:MAG: GNAT family N-acetyltransferase [Verrucomicrobia bacterium]|nr:GNAT family N-acetyltransferase [Verrucomicrobiota bacterium]
MKGRPPNTELTIRTATEEDLPLILSFIRELAEFERLAHEVEATESILRESLFGSRASAEVIFGCLHGQSVAFAVFFHNFSTFKGRSGLYLEDLYVKPAFRRQGIGQALMLHLARIAVERHCGRFEWAALNWNQPAIEFYEKLGAIGLKEWTVFRVAGEALARLAQSELERRKG